MNTTSPLRTLPAGWRYTTCPKCGATYATPARAVQQGCVVCHYFLVDAPKAGAS